MSIGRRNNATRYIPIPYEGNPSGRPTLKTISIVRVKYGGTWEKVSENRFRSVVNASFDSHDKEVTCNEFDTICIAMLQSYLISLMLQSILS